MIYGTGIRLRAIEREDLPRFVTWLNDPEVIAGLILYLPMSLGDEENWYQGMMQRPPVEHPLVIEIKENDEWKMIGNIGLHNIDWRCRSVEVGIVIGEKRLWGRGHGTKAMRLMLRHAFNTLNMNRVYLRVYETNPRAIRSYEKVGFIHEGRERQGMYIDGRFCDVLLMSVLREEWKDEG